MRHSLWRTLGAFRFGRGKCIRWIKSTRVTGRRWPRRAELVHVSVSNEDIQQIEVEPVVWRAVATTQPDVTMIKEGTKTNNAEKKEHRKGNKFVSGLLYLKMWSNFPQTVKARLFIRKVSKLYSNLKVWCKLKK